MASPKPLFDDEPLDMTSQIQQAMSEEIGGDIDYFPAGISTEADASSSSIHSKSSVSSWDRIFGGSRPSRTADDKQSLKSASRPASQLAVDAADIECPVRLSSIKGAGDDTSFNFSLRPSSINKGGDDASIASRNSMSSWITIFSGKSQPASEGSQRTRQSSHDPTHPKPKTTSAAQAALSRIKTIADDQATQSNSQRARRHTRPLPRDNAHTHTRAKSSSISSRPVISMVTEMDALIDSNELPPTMNIHKQPEAPTTDQFGFPILPRSSVSRTNEELRELTSTKDLEVDRPDDLKPLQHSKASKSLTVKDLEAITTKWNEFLRKVRESNDSEEDALDGIIGIASLGQPSNRGKYREFRQLVLAGIPVSLRPKIWAECSGASSMRIPGYYDDLVRKQSIDDPGGGGEVDEDIAQQIKADIHRTLTHNTFFRYGPGVQRLEELLRAYSIHNPRIGYCQGMNLITASLLLICATAEDCFWLLVAIIDQILPSGYFDRNLLVSRADQVVLRSYVEELLPKIDNRFKDLGVELEVCTFHWFLSLYTGVLTGGETLYRIWDIVLCLNSSDGVLPNSANSADHDGTSSPFLIQIALALLKINEAELLSLESTAAIYHDMTSNGALATEGLAYATEAFRGYVKRVEVLERRKKAVLSLSGT